MVDDAVRPDRACERAFTAPSISTTILTSQLMEEVDRLAKSHHEELEACLERWRSSLQESHPMMPGQQRFPILEQHPMAMSTFEPMMPSQQPPLLEPHPLGVDAFEPCEPPKTVLDDASNGGQEELAPLTEADQPSSESPTVSPYHSTASIIQPRSYNNEREKIQVDSKVNIKKPARDKKKRRTVNDLLPKSKRAAQTTQSWVHRVTSSRYYEWASGSLICLNAVFIGWQTQYVAQHAEANVARNLPPEAESPAAFLVLQVIFCLLFSTELGLRWICDGLLGFFLTEDTWWNVLDVTVVSISVLDLLMHLVIDENDFLGNLSVLRVLRVVRVARVARVIRIMKFFRELRMMVYSILSSMKSLLWVIIVLGMMFYIFGITFTMATSTALDTKAKWVDPSTQDLRSYFGSLDSSILSLFMAMSGGHDWAAFYRSMEDLPAGYRLLFLLYITFALFAVVNIVTGVFVESAMQSSNDDKVITAHEELEAKKDYLRSMREIFDEMDEDDTGSVSIAEFEAKLDDERVIAYFNAMKLDVSDARRLFWLIDFDQSGEVDIDEFLTGCYKLQGDSRSLDMKLMQCEVRFLQESFVLFSEKLSKIHHGVNELQAKTLS